MELIIFILICYGVTNIITISSIFHPLRNWIKDKNEMCEGLRTWNPTDIVFFEKIWYIFNDFRLNSKRIDLLEKHRRLLSTAKTAEEIDYYTDSIEDVQKSLQNSIPQNSVVLKLVHIFWSKMDQLINCQMCTGFWVGLFVMLSFAFTAPNMFLYMFDKTADCTVYAATLSLIFYGCISSGTCWIIHNIVERLEKDTDD
jgi:hypothetical protein